MKRSLQEIADLLMPNISMLRYELKRDLDIAVEENKIVLIERFIVLDDSLCATRNEQTKHVADFINNIRIQGKDL